MCNRVLHGGMTNLPRPTLIELQSIYGLHTRIPRVQMRSSTTIAVSCPQQGRR